MRIRERKGVEGMVREEEHLTNEHLTSDELVGTNTILVSRLNFWETE